MSNRRRSGMKNLYRTDFLRSPAWYARRTRWFRDHTPAGGLLACAGCGQEALPGHLELHHLDYQGVTLSAGTWQAWEKDDDLVPLHPYCHDLLHRLIDRDTILTAHRSRRDATAHALRALRTRLTREVS